jgi:hypothetical protein
VGIAELLMLLFCGLSEICVMVPCEVEDALPTSDVLGDRMLRQKKDNAFGTMSNTVLDDGRDVIS